MLLHYFLAWILYDKKSVKSFCSSVCNVSSSPAFFKIVSLSLVSGSVKMMCVAFVLFLVLIFLEIFWEASICDLMSFIIFMNSWALCLQMFLLLTASPSLFLPGFWCVGQFDIFPQFLNARFHFLFLTFFSLRFSFVISVDLSSSSLIITQLCWVCWRAQQQNSLLLKPWFSSVVFLAASFF